MSKRVQVDGRNRLTYPACTAFCTSFSGVINTNLLEVRTKCTLGTNLGVTELHDTVMPKLVRAKAIKMETVSYVKNLVNGVFYPHFREVLSS